MHSSPGRHATGFDNEIFHWNLMCSFFIPTFHIKLSPSSQEASTASRLILVKLGTRNP